MSEEDAERRRLRAALGGLAAGAKLTPDERVERARKAGKASGESRRKAREAAGLGPSTTSKPGRTLPSAEDLAPYLEAIDAETHGDEFTYEYRYRQAVLMLRRDVAAQALASLNRPDDQ